MHDWDQDHVHDGADDASEYDLERLDRIVLTSVGVDVGSATSQLIFSRLLLRRMSVALSSRYVVYSREILYQSPIFLTPYESAERIDAEALQAIFERAYRASGLRADAVDTGAVILTGEAIRRRNARAIGDMFAAQGGRFVCATAGHHMESLLAAHGSGAVALSHDQNLRILNIDVGGGTTKLARIVSGRVVETAALHAGGRLLAVDGDGRIVRIEAAAERLGGRLGFDWRLGASVTERQLQAAADWMADAIVAAVCEAHPPEAVSQLLLTPPLGGGGEVDGIVFSGGVAEYVYGNEQRSFGDLGPVLGAALRRRVEDGTLPWPVMPARERIRATVIGASQYSVQVSGSTIYLSDPSLLPARNLRVLRPRCTLGEVIDPEEVAGAIRRHLEVFDVDERADEVALALHWHGDPTYQRLERLGEGIRMALSGRIEAQRPLVVVLDGDVGRALGTHLKEERGLPCEVLSLDGITLRDFDFVDIGQRLEPSGPVPVTIKSLVFQL